MFKRRVLKPFDPSSLAEFEEIHALPLIAEYIGDADTYRWDYSYELNIVLKNGSRISVIQRENQTKLREDAHALSTFLGKPVWDASDCKEFV